LQVAGALSSPNTIDFDIPTTDPGYSAATQTWLIAPGSSLPTVTAPVFINGYSQPGASANTNGPGLGKNTVLKIELDGGNAPVLLNGLTISAGASTVSGLVIDGCNIGIDLTGGGGDTIAGNFIGTDVTGKLRVGSSTGLEMDSVGKVTVGGTAAGAGNVIAGNVVGILSQQTALTTTDDLVEGNFIGTDVTGTAALYETDGVELANDSGDTIGGTTAGAGNLISGNTFHGISVGLGSQETTDSVVEGNSFGTDVTGAMKLSNSFAATTGAAVELIGSGDKVGGSAAGAGNLIALNGFNGVEVAHGTDNLISRNAIFGNQGGIRVDSGANPGVTAPVLTAATVNPDDSVTVQGTLQNETPGEALTIELFANATNYAAGQEQGQSFVTSTTAMADASGNASFSVTVTPPDGEPDFTATATDSRKSTSAFSNSLGAGVGTPVDLAVSDAVDPGPVAVGSNLGYTFTVENQGTAMATGVKLTHLLPASATFVSAVASQGAATQNAGTVTAQLGDIAGGAAATVRVVVQPQAGGSVEIAARVIADQFIFNPTQSVTSIPVDVSPAAPTNVAAKVVSETGGSNSLAVTWSYTPPRGSVVTYNVYRGETPGSEGTTPYVTGLTTDQFTDTGEVPGHVYYYQVTATIGGLESLHSNEAGATILTAPTSLNGQFVTTSSFEFAPENAQLTWQYPAAAGSGVRFNIYRSGTSGGEGNTPYCSNLEQAAIGDVGLVPGHVYFYQVSATYGGRVGPRSTELELAVPALTAPILDPPSTGLNSIGQTEIELNWTDTYLLKGPSSLYKVYLATTSGAEAAQRPIEWSDTDILLLEDPGTTIYIQVSTARGPYESPLSNEQQVTVPPLSAPVLTGSTASWMGHLVPEIAWTSPLGLASRELHYNIYRSSTPGGEGSVPFLSGVMPPAVYPNYLDASATPGVYYYQVTAVVDSYESPRSNEVLVRTAPSDQIVQIRVQLPKAVYKAKSTDIVLSFTSALDEVDAENLAAYHLVTLGKLNKKTGRRATRPVKVTSALYDPTADTVTLALKGRLPNQPLQLSVNTSAVLDASGQPIAGSSGQAGTNLQATFRKKGVALAAEPQ
jgi:uncharacterized repeat protein (TIGR01451 family)